MSKPKKILLADDEAQYAEALLLVLRKAGYDVDMVPNGHAALDALKNEKYDLFILDILMPMVTGLQVLEMIKKWKDPVPPIIVLTNLGNEKDMAYIQSLGIERYLHKGSIPAGELCTIAGQCMAC